jgi:chromate transporter
VARPRRGATLFIAPAAAITVALEWAYVRFGALPGAIALLAGTGPSVLLVGGAACGLAWGWRRPVMATIVVVLGGRASLAALASLAGSSHAPPRLVEIATFFLKIGAILYGSGYVLVALLRTLVSPLGWLTEQQLLDSIAAGQVTPGPALTTATFIGYLLNGPIGAVIATVAIFLPAFFFVSILEPVIRRVGTSLRARRFLDVVNATAVGLMAGVAIQLTGNLSGRPHLWPAAIVAAAIGLAGYSTVWMLLAAVLLTLLVNFAAL